MYYAVNLNNLSTTLCCKTINSAKSVSNKEEHIAISKSKPNLEIPV